MENKNTFTPIYHKYRKNEKLKLLHMAILGTVESYENNGLQCKESNSTMAKHFHTSPRTISNYINELEKMNLIIVSIKNRNDRVLSINHNIRIEKIDNPIEKSARGIEKSANLGKKNLLGGIEKSATYNTNNKTIHNTNNKTAYKINKKTKAKTKNQAIESNDQKESYEELNEFDYDEILDLESYEDIEPVEEPTETTDYARLKEAVEKNKDSFQREDY